MKKRFNLSFKYGITNNPSDMVCDDNALAAQIGLTFDDNSHIPIQNPYLIGETEKQIIFVHYFQDFTHYIAFEDGALVYYDSVDLTSEIPITIPVGFIPDKVTAIGKTLIMSSNQGLAYFLWKDNQYKYLGSKPPEIVFKASLYHETYEDDFLDSGYLPPSIYVPDYPLTVNKQEDKEPIIGAVERILNEIKKQKKFAFPFFVRLAYKLYDGNYIMPTAPVLLFPSVRNNHDFEATELDSNGFHSKAFVSTGSLYVSVNTNFGDWKDLIESIDVFVTKEVRNFDVNDTWTLSRVGSNAGEYSTGRTTRDYIGETTVITPSQHIYVSQSAYYEEGLSLNDAATKFTPTLKSDTAIINDLSNQGNFYRIASIVKNGSPVSGAIVSYYMDDYALLNLDTQERLDHDDFHSYCNVFPDSIMSYNGRLHLSSISRDFYSGPVSSMPLYKYSNNATYHVVIDSESGERVIQITPDANEAYGYYFYYPDSRAKKLIVSHGANHYEYPLTQHPFLNGAYMLYLPSSNNNRTGDSTTAPTTNDDQEYIPNQIMVSEVNNPFMFTSEGFNQIGSGKIYAITSNTTALSEGQFGQYPLYAFTSEGIWALSVNAEGLYETARPVSRDICSNPDSITQTDNAIFFATEKGLMILSGSKVKCVSTLLNGKENTFLSTLIPIPTLRSILQTGKIAYDYKKQVLWIYTPPVDTSGVSTSSPTEEEPTEEEPTQEEPTQETDTQETSSETESSQTYYAYLYNIKSQTFSIYATTDPFITHANLYPDNILQTRSLKLLSLIKTPNINDDNTTYSGSLVTRPIKMGDALAYKTIFRLQHMALLENENINTTIYASDDLFTWQQLISLHGFPWKFYAFKIDFEDLKATDSYHGLITEVQYRHTNRFRPEDPNQQQTSYTLPPSPPTSSTT